MPVKSAFNISASINVPCFLTQMTLTKQVNIGQLELSDQDIESIQAFLTMLKNDFLAWKTPIDGDLEPRTISTGEEFVPQISDFVSVMFFYNKDIGETMSVFKNMLDMVKKHLEDLPKELDLEHPLEGIEIKTKPQTLKTDIGEINE